MQRKDEDGEDDSIEIKWQDGKTIWYDKDPDGGWKKLAGMRSLETTSVEPMMNGEPRGLQPICSQS